VHLDVLHTECITMQYRITIEELRMNTVKLIDMLCEATTAVWHTISTFEKLSKEALAREDISISYLTTNTMRMVRDIYKALPEELKTNEATAAADDLYWHIHDTDGKHEREVTKKIRDINNVVFMFAHDANDTMFVAKQLYGFVDPE
jgi:hypothetical protein